VLIQDDRLGPRCPKILCGNDPDRCRELRGHFSEAREVDKRNSGKTSPGDIFVISAERKRRKRRE